MTPLAHTQAADLLAQAWSAMDEGSPEQARQRAARYARQFIKLVNGVPVKRKSRSAPREVVCRTNPTVRYRSAAHAAIALGLKSRNSVVDAIEGGGTAGGLHWRYAEQHEGECPPATTKETPVVWRGKYYESIKDATRATLPEGTEFRAWQERVRRRAERKEAI